MENTESQTPLAAAQEMVEKCKGELSRLESTKKGLESKISATRAKIEMGEEIVTRLKEMALAPKKAS